MILVIDNYDSFTFNLVQALQAAGATVRVLRNDALDRAGLEAMADDPSEQPCDERTDQRKEYDRLDHVAQPFRELTSSTAIVPRLR